MELQPEIYGDEFNAQTRMWTIWSSCSMCLCCIVYSMNDL